VNRGAGDCPVSVLMPVYQPGEFIDAAIDSILGQTFEDFEFLIVDDGCDRHTAGRIEDWSRSDERVRLLRSPRNLGITQALNIGLAAARGEYIARFDADDIAMRHRLQRQVDFLRQHPDHVLVGSDCTLVDARGRRLAVDSHGWSRCELQLIALVRPPLVHPTAMFRRSVIQQHGLRYDDRYRCAEDFDFWVRMLRHGEMAIIPEVLLHYRVHSGAISQRKREMQWRNLYEIATRHLGRRLPELAGRRDEVQDLLRLLYLQPAPTARLVASAIAGAMQLADTFTARYRLDGKAAFRVRRLCIRWLAMGLARTRAWQSPLSLAPLLRQAPGLSPPLAAELVDYVWRRFPR
jgi:GT2 family glycosyltransferase